jgi:hypothetical protein
MKLDLPIYSYDHRSRPFSSARLLNCYPEVMPPGSPYPVVLMRAPGTKDWTTVGTGSILGMWRANIGFASGRLDRLYVVSGRELYSVDTAGSATLIGDIGTPNNLDFAYNTDNLVIVNEPNAFYYDGATFGAITDPDFTSRGAGNVEFLENFLLFREPNSDRMFGADLGSATSFDSLNFVNADSNPDLLKGIISDHRNLVCFGDETTELYVNTGASGFPFERIINGTMQVGLAAENLYGRCFDIVYFIADDLTVRRLDGNQPVRISTHYIEQLLENTYTLSSGEAFSYWQEGHFFMGFTFLERTIVYDAVTQQWHERESYSRDYWRFRHMARFNGMTLTGDKDSNEVVEIDIQTYDEAVADPRMSSTVHVMEWTYQPIYAEGVRAFHDRLEVRFEAGVGLTTGQGSDPVMMMEFSDDGGKTWNQLPTRTLGKKGEYEDRAVWHNLGSARQRVYRGSISDPVAVYIGDTVTEVRGGRL